MLRTRAGNALAFSTPQFHARVSLFIDGGNVLNMVSQDLVSKLRLVTEPLVKAYKVAWINGEKAIVSLMCKLDFYFGKYWKESVRCNVLP